MKIKRFLCTVQYGEGWNYIAGSFDTIEEVLAFDPYVKDPRTAPCKPDKRGAIPHVHRWVSIDEPNERN